ncbi:MAG: glycosyltransferase [Cyanobacteriota bacterium]
MYIQIYQVHGLIRSKNLELGIDEDTGGQIIYVIELAKALGNLSEVSRVDIVTRLFKDENHPGYSIPFENINDKVGIVRVPCGPSKYLRKVELRDYIDEFYDNIQYYIETEEDKPDVIHSNYVDAGYVCNKLSKEHNIPHVFTAHSLGKPKLDDLRTKSSDLNGLDAKYRFSKRIEAEQDIIHYADALIISCEQEKQDQFSKYNVKLNDPRFKVITPGVNAKIFKPFWDESLKGDAKLKLIREKITGKINSGLDNPDKPPILMLSRLDPKKNIYNMVDCYADDLELQEKANLIICAGKIKDRSRLSQQQLDVLDQIEALVERKNLNGKVFLFDEVSYEGEVPELFRLIGSKRGVFVDCDITDPLPITIIEAALAGIPVVANSTCALLDIISKGKSELLINVRKHHLLSGAIIKLIENKELWNHCSRAGVACILKELTWDLSARKVMNIYKEIISKRSG